MNDIIVVTIIIAVTIIAIVLINNIFTIIREKRNLRNDYGEQVIKINQSVNYVHELINAQNAVLSKLKGELKLIIKLLENESKSL